MSHKNLIALAVIAAGVLAADSVEIPKGASFKAPDDIADRLIASGEAKLDAPLEQGKASKKVKVRLLVDSAYGNCNDVVQVDADDVKALKEQGLADDSKAAVSYALTLPQNEPQA